MDHEQQIDHAEHRYLSELCPVCDQSPCAGGGGKGSCEPANDHLDMAAIYREMLEDDQ